MEIIDDQPEDAARQAELDGNRIHQFAALRRGAIRSRSWLLITAIICGIAAMELFVNLIQLLRASHAWGWWATGYSLGSITTFALAVVFMRKAGAMKVEIEKSALDQPAGAPDFSTLSDGSQRWRNLEDL